MFRSNLLQLAGEKIYFWNGSKQQIFLKTQLHIYRNMKDDIQQDININLQTLFEMFRQPTQNTLRWRNKSKYSLCSSCYRFAQADVYRNQTTFKVNGK